MSGFPALHCLLDLAQIHVHWGSDANHLLLCTPSHPAFSLSLSGSSLMNCLLWIRWTKYWSFSFSISPSSEYSGPFLFSCALTFCRGLFNIVEIYSNAFIMLTVLFPFIFFLSFPFSYFPIILLTLISLSFSLSHTHMSVFPAEMKPVLITNQWGHSHTESGQGVLRRTATHNVGFYSNEVLTSSLLPRHGPKAAICLDLYLSLVCWQQPEDSDWLENTKLLKTEWVRFPNRWLLCLMLI